MDTTLIRPLILSSIELCRLPTNPQGDRFEFSMSVTASAWFKTVAPVSEDAEITRSLIKVVGKIQAAIESAGISSPENVYERTAGSGLIHHPYRIWVIANVDVHSHDFERALCRFWLRGTCAKGETCEFLHTLPNNIDVNGITSAMARTDLNNQARYSKESSPPPDEFPTLDRANGSGTNKKGGTAGYGTQGHHDPGRTRFAAAVKKPAPAPRNEPAITPARRDTGIAGELGHHRVSVVAPRPSPRLKLRPPTLLPTLPTGDSVNKMYMGYRSRALQLGAARNACLSRAADAWRRGDGAAAKRFSREGHELNAKMSSEMADAAGQLVKERAKLAEQAVRGRDVAWSDDPGDRTSRGKVIGKGLGVCLGIARLDVGGAEKLSPEERTEATLDLHGLHANEATEVLESFLLAVSNISVFKRLLETVF